MEKLGQNNIYSQYLGNKAILRTYKGTDLINEYVPLYTPPVDWSDIRTDCPENSIALYAAHSADYSSYNNLGFTANCIGGYNVFIDGTQYGSTYASGSNCTITWSTSGITTGDDITTPSTFKAHKIWISPATSGNNITRFASVRVSTGSENEFQGKLWIHFNLSNTIQVSNLLRASGTYSVNNICKAITAKNNRLNCAANIGSMCQNGSSLEYLPVLVSSGEAGTGIGAFNGCEILKSITLKNFKFSTFNYGCNNCYLLERIKHSNTEILNSVSNGTINSQYNECRKLQNILPETYTANISRAQNYIHNAPELKDSVIDLRGATALTELGIFSSNSTYFAKGIKGVRVSNEAPFDRAITPQIDVRYTNLDRSALVQLFNDLPYNVGYEVVGSPTISSGVVSGFSNVDYLQTSTSIDWSNISNYEIVIRAKVSSGSSLIGLGAGGAGEWKIIFASSYIYFTTSLYAERIQTSYSFDADTYYYIRLRYNNTTAILDYSTDGINYQGEVTGSFENLTTKSGFVKLGYLSNYGASSAFDGSIDLNNTYIKINDVYWFKGQPAMTKTLSCVGATGNQLVTVGSPTIVDGVVSGFSASNKLTLTQTFDPKKPYKFQTKFNLSSIGNAGTLFGVSTTGIFNIGVVAQTNLLRFVIGNTSADFYVLNISGTTVLSADTDYWAEAEFTGTKYVLRLSTDGIVWNEENSITSSTVPNPGTPFTLQIGDGHAQHWYLRGSIDLNETYIKNNGEYLYRTDVNALLPEDKAIVTNKNWTLTLS